MLAEMDEIDFLQVNVSIEAHVAVEQQANDFDEPVTYERMIPQSDISELLASRMSYCPEVDHHQGFATVDKITDEFTVNNDND